MIRVLITILFLGIITTSIAVACRPKITPIISPTIIPTVIVSPTVVPTITLTVTPTASLSATATPSTTVTPTSQPSASHVDVSDGRSDGLHTAPDGLGCAAHPCGELPKGAPMTGRAE